MPRPTALASRGRRRAILTTIRSFRGFDRITSDPGLLGGKPCIRGQRISVQRLLEILAQSPSWEVLRADYPEIEAADIQQALGFAAALLTDTIIPLDNSAA